ncbi:MAG: hypothetical protein IJ730_04890 [Alphaproteobacteria bacterium]|nr:hypothetical protein [Alphaproteobacteria bacterium]
MKKLQKLFFTIYSFFFIFFNVFSSEHYNTLIVMDKRAEPTSIFLGYNPSYIAPLKINEFDRINIEEIEKIVCESFFNKSICEYLTNYKPPLTKNLSEMNEQMKQIINNDKNQKKIFSEAMEQTFKKANPNIPHVAICRITIISKNNIGYVYPIPYLFLSGSEDSSEKRLMQASIKIVIPFIKTLTSYKIEVSSQQYYAHSERVIAMCLKDPNEPFSLQNIVQFHNSKYPADPANSAVIQLKNAKPSCKGCKKCWTLGDNIVETEEGKNLFCSPKKIEGETFSPQTSLQINHSYRVSNITDSNIEGYPTVELKNRCGLSPKYPTTPKRQQSITTMLDSPVNPNNFINTSPTFQFHTPIRSSHEENLPNINDENFNFSPQFGMFTSSSTLHQVSEQITTYPNIATLAS